ncbi:hypothetical protein [Halorussus aquaticus]|uniref:Tetrapyrrole biosynthesis glutamyl-tRNA reductase dimerisation domain-containing protein n=1 Tax=Halorussus aquaticus TaxID=2953748 RepID=A0ABD5Q653_9EURY|nr:hypothetical protein [Halorussus aquaticus]
MTRLAEPNADPGETADAGGGRTSGGEKERREVADRLRDRAERVRRRELETALGRLEATGEVTPAERRAVASLSASITDALVERWASNLDEVDADAALGLFADRE